MLNSEFNVKTYAKLNLSLLVYQARPDKYHPICSIFQNISLADNLKITIIKPKELILSSDNTTLPLDQTNILSKVFDQVKEKLDYGFKIHLQKEIPLGGGLGGGSTNAAGFISFLNEIMRLDFTKEALTKLALNTGADVTFFLLGKGTALVSGIGEIVEPISKGKTNYFLLINPKIEIPTKFIYQKFDELKNIQKFKKIPIYLRTKLIGTNSLSSVVFASYPKMKQLKEQITSFGLKLFLSGSGATCFIPFKNQQKALYWESKIKEMFPDYFIRLTTSKTESHIISAIN
ncbi:MAG: 4-(cytidine 5'-diphospho)-2-C-methyl-D-erythritol kinase [Candidatus Margulisiibacteriota bacterium]|jgi:4-diphosphocytidyl-2-C-methyl-D-erythritol kinase